MFFSAVVRCELRPSTPLLPLKPGVSGNLNPESHLRAYFETLYSVWGRQHWWPAQSRFEVVVGAYLTQNTSWTNVEKALANLRRARRLTVRGIREIPLPALERLIRPAGYFRQKARRLKTFVRFLDRQYGGSLQRMFSEPTPALRAELLALNGVGPETADSILLYAGSHPVFVVDAYTRRVLERHELSGVRARYDEIRELFERALVPLASTAVPEIVSDSGMNDRHPRGSSHPPSPMSVAPRSALAQIFNEMHGLIVGVGKNYCLKSQMRCEQCPLQKFLPG